MRIGMHLGPFHASTTVGRPRRRHRSGGAAGAWVHLAVLALQLCVWACWLSLLACWWLTRLAWTAGVWLAGFLAGRRQQRREAEAARLAAAADAARTEHARLVASLRPEDVDFLRRNGWQEPEDQPRQVSAWA